MFKFSSIDRENQVEENNMSTGEENNNDGKWKVVGCRVTEDELQNDNIPRG
jgi:nitrous oxide reductase